MNYNVNIDYIQVKIVLSIQTHLKIFVTVFYQSYLCWLVSLKVFRKSCLIVNKIHVSTLFQGKWVRSNMLMKIVIIKRPMISISELLNCSCIISTALINKTLKHKTSCKSNAIKYNLRKIMWWHTSIISAHGKLRQGRAGVCGQPELHSKMLSQ